jgi:hypothetical protein
MGDGSDLMNRGFNKIWFGNGDYNNYQNSLYLTGNGLEILDVSKLINVNNL